MDTEYTFIYVTTDIDTMGNKTTDIYNNYCTYISVNKTDPLYENSTYLGHQDVTLL